MALFGFGKKMEEAAPACACQCGCPTAEADVSKIAEEISGNGGGTLSVKVLGTGCASCHALLENTKAAVTTTGVQADVEYVTDLARIAGYGVMSMPALVVNEKVVAMGKVLKSEEVADLLRKLQG